MEKCCFAIIATLPRGYVDNFTRVFDSNNLATEHFMHIDSYEVVAIHEDGDMCKVYISGTCRHSVYMCMLPTQESYYYKSQIAKFCVADGVPVRNDIDMREFPSMRMATNILEVCGRLSVSCIVYGFNDDIDLIEIYTIVNDNLTYASINERNGSYTFT